MRKVLDKRFFHRPVLKVAEDLVGKYLVRKIGRKEIALMITETEAYDGEKDLACHASKGRTARTEVMFGEAGHWYVYLVYGMYEMLNIVTGPKDYPAAVLIRAAGKAGGPGKLTRLLEIDRRLNTKPAMRTSGLWIEDRGIKIKKSEILKTPRIGINYAGDYWAKKPWRFVLNKKTTLKKRAVS
ncbi:MAG TPA: DNA-3-methyladenine glycosylase [Candidatus Paceibacterota bacterium]|nr:DNA-3-methyladenine glycosylase [Candidatus Paceibacterota bacterium]